MRPEQELAERNNLQAENDELKQKNGELHRRCQLAEGAVLRKMKAEQFAGAPLAKRLAMAGYAAEQERRLEADELLRRSAGALAEPLGRGVWDSNKLCEVIEAIADYFNKYGKTGDKAQ